MIIRDIEKMIKDLSNIKRGSFTEPQIVMFHGGCNGCTQQFYYGVDLCIGCQYFCANWSLPNLSNHREATATRVRAEVLERAREKSLISKFILFIDRIVGGRR